MAAPNLITRTTPGGRHLPDGWSSLVRFALGLVPGLAIREFEITPGKLSVGPPIKQSTFFNTVWETMLFQTLLKVDDFKIKGQLSTTIFAASGGLQAVTGKNQSMSFIWPDGASLSFYGAPIDFTFGVIKQGTLPEIDMTVAISNFDPVNRVEAGWAYVAGYVGTPDG